MELHTQRHISKLEFAFQYHGRLEILSVSNCCEEGVKLNQVWHMRSLHYMLSIINM